MKKLIWVIIVVLAIGAGFILVKFFSGGGNNSGSTTKVNLANEDIAQIPVAPYPGATRTTESIEVPKDLVVVVAKQSSFAQYETTDSPEKVKDYYKEGFAKRNISQGQPRESGVIVYTAGDHRYALYITAIEGKTVYVIGVGTEK